MGHLLCRYGPDRQSSVTSSRAHDSWCMQTLDGLMEARIKCAMQHSIEYISSSITHALSYGMPGGRRVTEKIMGCDLLFTAQ